jgi:hypothetical protein
MKRNFPHVRGARSWMLGGAVTLGVAGLCASRTPQHTSPHPRSLTREPIALTAAKYQMPPAEALPIVIAIDATQHGPDDPTALQAIQEAILHIDPKMPIMSPVSTEAAPSEPGWVLWGRLGTTPSPVSVPPDTGITAAAFHSAQGMTLCLVNRSTEKKLLRLQIRLPRGVYKGERLTFSPPNVVAQAPADRRTLPTGSRLRTVSDDGQESNASPTVTATQLERLQGRTLNAATVVRKPCLLLPGQVCFYRYTDVAQAGRAALNETYDALHAMAGRSPNPAQRLRHILEEGDGARGSLSLGNGRNSSARLSGIHRLLLLTAQVQSMQRNYQQRHVVDAQQGAEVMGALERLTDALAETSAALLELVPQITVREESMPDAVAASGAADTPAPLRRLTVTVSLANLGRQSLGMVKLGLATADLPRGVACEPDDPAYFGSVHPGQSVRATFHLRCPAGTALPIDRCGGDVSYFVSGTPAHLRIRAW